MKLHTTRVGAGSRTTILLHGYLGSGRNLWSAARGWSLRDASRTFLLPDLPGHGESPPLIPNATLRTMARDVLDTADSQPVDIVGHSLGGRVALAALEIDPDAVGSIAMLDIGPGAVGEAGEDHTHTAEKFAAVSDYFTLREDARAALDAQGLTRPTVDWLLMNLVPRDGGFGWRVNRQALLDLRPTINATDLWPIAEKYAPRIVCIRGAKSDYVSDADAKRMEAFGVRVVTIEDAGHFLHVDRPKGLLAALMASLPTARKD